MAQPQRVVDLAGDEEMPAWRIVIDLHTTGVLGRWTLVGGLMVHAYRFRHADGRVIDLMVADHLPNGIRARLAGRPAFPAEGGQQAIDRREVTTRRCWTPRAVGSQWQQAVGSFAKWDASSGIPVRGSSSSTTPPLRPWA